MIFGKTPQIQSQFKVEKSLKLKIVENESCSVYFAVLYTFMWCCVGVNCQVFIKRQLKKSISFVDMFFVQKPQKALQKMACCNSFKIQETLNIGSKMLMKKFQYLLSREHIITIKPNYHDYQNVFFKKPLNLNPSQKLLLYFQLAGMLSGFCPFFLLFVQP